MAQKTGDDVLFFQYGAGGVPLGFVYNGVQHFYITNQLGDVMGIANAQGEPIAAYSYDEWGNPIETVTRDDTEEQNKIAQLNPLRYRGYYYDAETGYYYLQSRYYNPEWGRFISPDSFGYIDNSTRLGFNAYVYCVNNPIMFVDHSGNIGRLAVAFVLYGVLFVSGALLVYILLSSIVAGLSNTTFSFSLPSVSLPKISAASIADTAIKSAISNNQHTKYWAARRTSGYVILIRALSFSEAMQRVKRGSDVFASTQADAFTLASSITATPIGPEIDSGKQYTAGYYFHYHISRSNTAHIFFL